MNIKHFTSLAIGLFLCVLFFSSCNKSDDNDETNYIGLTNDAQIYSFSFSAPITVKSDSLSRAQDSLRIRVVNRTKYAIDQVGSIIYNPDSLPYLTQLKKVKVDVSFNPTYGISEIEVKTPDSTFNWNTTDSLDFSRMPIYFKVKSRGDSTKTYHIDIRTHKVNPEMIVWAKMTSLTNLGVSKTLLKDNVFYNYTIVGNTVKLATSNKNNIVWVNKTVTGLPSKTNVESLYYVNSLFNAVDNAGNSYQSVDGASWSKVNNSLYVKSIVGVLPTSGSDLLLTIIYDSVGGNYYFAKGSNLSAINKLTNVGGAVLGRVPDGFPLNGASSTPNYSSRASEQLLVVNGGADKSNVLSNNTWLVQNTTNGIDITYFTSQANIVRGIGTSTVVYDGSIYFLKEKQFYSSNNWGYLWTKAAKEQQTPSAMQAINGQTVIVDTDNYIWILGGKSSVSSYTTDVWRGRLNKLAY